MSKEKRSYVIRIGGAPVEVTKSVYTEYFRAARRIRYYEEDIKTGKILVSGDKVTFVPCKEDSIERLEDEAGVEFFDECESVEDVVIRKLMAEKLRRSLPLLEPDERRLIDELFFNGKSERQLAAETEIPRMTICSRKHKILAKLRKLLEK